MNPLQIENGRYTTIAREISFAARLVPSFHFWARFVGIVFRSGVLARIGKYDEQAWMKSSRRVFDYVEDVGISIHVEGVEHLQGLQEPCVIVGNHMSLLETVLLPALVLPTRHVTYVVKEDLLKYPVFKDVIKVCRPIAVSRNNPRQDLKTVLTEGSRRLQDGTSIIIFPQSTRSRIFAPEQMSSIGVKLAKKADVPIIPLALKTDAVKNGKMIKDIGPLDTSMPVHFKFGAPFRVDGKGVEEQKMLTDFIGENIRNWTKEPAVV